VGDESLFKTYGQQLGLVERWWSGQEHRVRCGSDGLLLVVVIGAGQLVVPVDLTARRPDPEGPGKPCRGDAGVCLRRWFLRIAGVGMRP
jgi:hypothetical protein